MINLKSIYESLEIDSDRFMDIKFDLERKYENSKYYFHGTNRIDAINTISDIKPQKRTVDSEYLYISPKVGTALTYSSIGNWKFDEQSGIIVFKIVGGKKYKFNRDDKLAVTDWDSFNRRLDEIKKSGYDYVTGTQNDQELIILNNDILKIIEKIKISDI